MSRRSIDSWLDRFAHRHPRFGVPHLINYILMGNVIIYVLDLFSNSMLSTLLSLDFGMAAFGLQPWRFVTFIFVPDASKPIWFVVSLFFYYFLGNTMENEWGTAKFNLFYLSGALLTILASVVTFFWSGGAIGFGTLSAVHSTLFLAFATLYPDAQIRVYFVLPVKAKWLAVFYVFMGLWDIIGVNRLFIQVVLPLLLPQLLASWINYVIFFWSDLTALFARAFRRARHQNSRQTVNFKEATRHAQQNKGYLHKCAVCGKTDTDHPDMEFRYCSKCNGYYCYCMEHIGNHVHIE